MTVTYTAEVATCRGFGCFLKLLLRYVLKKKKKETALNIFDSKDKFFQNADLVRRYNATCSNDEITFDNDES